MVDAIGAAESHFYLPPQKYSFRRLIEFWIFVDIFNP